MQVKIHLKSTFINISQLLRLDQLFGVVGEEESTSLDTSAVHGRATYRNKHSHSHLYQWRAVRFMSDEASTPSESPKIVYVPSGKMRVNDWLCFIYSHGSLRTVVIHFLTITQHKQKYSLVHNSQICSFYFILFFFHFDATVIKGPKVLLSLASSPFVFKLKPSVVFDGPLFIHSCCRAAANTCFAHICPLWWGMPCSFPPILSLVIHPVDLHLVVCMNWWSSCCKLSMLTTASAILLIHCFNST